MPYYLDEDLSHKAAALARRSGVDVVSSLECNRNGSSDEDQLAFAAEQGRVLVSQDYAGFSRLTKRFASEGRDHAGVLLLASSISNGDYAGIAAAIARYDREHPQGLAPYMLDYLRPARRS
ncbi:MAG: DUF5615 family PIN-like protein [Dehalococcoidia bacterium]